MAFRFGMFKWARNEGRWVLLIVFSTARCSSSRNSLRGITHHPSIQSTFWWRCYLQLWWYFYIIKAINVRLSLQEYHLFLFSEKEKHTFRLISLKSMATFSITILSNYYYYHKNNNTYKFIIISSIIFNEKERHTFRFMCLESETQ